MSDPNSVVANAKAAVAGAETAALSFGQKWWWAFTAGALAVGFVLGLVA
jgi:hypothetical protein